jgi:hypothetical protein
MTLEKEKQKLIARLKTVKDPREREKILWTLEGLKKAPAATVDQQKTVEATSGPAQAEERIPIQLPKGITLLTQFAVPAFMAVFGLISILTGIFKGLENGDFASETGRFIAGAIFIVMGLGGLRKAGKPQSMPQTDRKSDEEPPGA